MEGSWNPRGHGESLARAIAAILRHSGFEFHAHAVVPAHDPRTARGIRESRRGFRPHYARSSACVALFAASALFVAPPYALAADPPPAPSKTSVLNQSVTNPATGETTVVTGLIADPAGTPTANATAFVTTADGWTFLVKDVGELVYTTKVDEETNEPRSLLIVSADATAHTVVLDPRVKNAGTQTISTWLDATEYQKYFSATNGTPTKVDPLIDAVDGVRVVLTGSRGYDGHIGVLFVPPSSGGDGDDGPAATYPASYPNPESIYSTTKIGLEVGSIGGRGGDGGGSYLNVWSGRGGGNGGKGGIVDLTSRATKIETVGAGLHGIFAYSRSGAGGNGGKGWAAPGGGTGGLSSDASDVTIDNYSHVLTDGAGAFGVYALSVGNIGGNGGNQWGFVGSAGSAGYGGAGGIVTVKNHGKIETSGAQSHGIVAQSVGGTGGSSGTSWNLLLSLNAAADNGGSGHAVNVDNDGTIVTHGAQSRGIYAQSLGGGGGIAGDTGGLIAIGGAGSKGGSGGAVTVRNLAGGTITTLQTESDAIFAQSVGGSGGSGANSSGLVALGGKGGAAGNGAAVTVQNFGTVTTSGTFSRGIVAESIGGGGGDGGASGGFVTIGGDGEGGGDSALVTVVNAGTVRTTGADSSAIYAQAVGGGGGTGGSTRSVSAFVGVAVGGAGGGGGKGGDVNVTLQGIGPQQASQIVTSGARSTGVFAQSVGGGGGTGGGAVSVTGGFGVSASIAIGGEGGKGGNGGLVTMSRGTGGSTVIVTGSKAGEGPGGSDDATRGDDSPGVFLQSVGGGGGNGGSAISVATSGGIASGSLSVSVGGTGGDGGIGGDVTVGTFDDVTHAFSSTGFDGSIVTLGERSTGFLAQSIGGGGGNGGFAVAVSATAAAGIGGAFEVGIGGSGATGGAGGVVSVGYGGSIRTEQDHSTGLLVQSVGGGGGNGGGTVGGGVALAGGGAGKIGVNIGGSGGTANDGGYVTLVTRAGTNTPSEFTTLGESSGGIVAQSVGGGGGNGGFAITGGLAAAGGGAASIDVALGGDGGKGGSGGEVHADLASKVSTSASNSTGVLVQSVGGGGGNGGFTVEGSVTAAGAGSGSVAVGLGGNGSTAGEGGAVYASSSGTIDTRGDRSSGFVAQSIGGGGGNGGFNVSGTLTAAGTGAGAISVGLGGDGGGGGGGGAVAASTSGKVTTGGAMSTGILAQSVGGGGGNGGFNVNVTLAGAGTGAATIGVGLGGNGGSGSNASTVGLTVRNGVETFGAGSTAIVAQSVGGGGGNGGFNVTVSGAGAGTGSAGVGVGIGGSGAGAGDGEQVTASIEGDVTTHGKESRGVVVQSVGGGGGNGGVNITASIAAGGSGSATAAVGLGGGGGSGGSGGNVVAGTFKTDGSVATIGYDGALETWGEDATGFVAQSIGGGGGSGGVNVSAALTLSAGKGGAIAVGLGGAGGTGGNASSVDAALAGPVTTHEAGAAAIVAQSVGGGGGAGGLNVGAAISATKGEGGAVSVGLGGTGGGGGNASDVRLYVADAVNTWGAKDAAGVFAQSLGGGGGRGGLNVGAGITIAGGTGGTVTVGLGGSGAKGGNAGAVAATLADDATTRGANSTAFTAQSVGGGGGDGGLNVTGSIAASFAGAANIGVGLGGGGGDGGYGSTAKGTVTGNVTTFGDDSHGVLVQSVGGGGGRGGLNVTGDVTIANRGADTLAVGIGGFGGDGGSGGVVNGVVHGDVYTSGARSYGVLLQSLSRGGGDGGLNVGGAVSLTKETSGTAAIGIGGFGGDGGSASTVTGEVNGIVSTSGAGAVGVFAQSLGGGGGNGGLNVAGTVGLSTSGSATAAIGIGGFGGGASNADAVTLTRTGATYTSGVGSDGVVVQSLGGGGGNGGLNVSGGITGGTKGTAFTATFGLGGFGGGGGNGSTVNATVLGDVIATGVKADRYVTEDGVTTRVREGGSHGVMTQSLGGAGGLGGLNVSGGIALEPPGSGKSYAVNLGIGGFGGAGGNAAKVTLLVDTDTVRAVGDAKYGVTAQSIGGSGGAGGINVSGGVVMDGQLTVGVGGFGGAGGAGGVVDATVDANVYASGTGAIGFLAQSVGGGGGAGATNISGGVELARKSKAPSLVFGMGGSGGVGSASASVTAVQSGTIVVDGPDAIGVLAQSVGGGGGTGGLNVAGNLSLGKGFAAAVGIGGSGGKGADASFVMLTSDGAITVDGREALVVQAANATAAATASAGATAADVPPAQDPRVLEALKYRERASGILAQSVGGGGGNGGANFSGVATWSGNPIVVGVGGTGKGGGNAGAVTVNRGLTTPSLLLTRGENAAGLTAQSIGGGGGNAGMNFAFDVAPSKDKKLEAVIAVGGAGGEPGDGSTVTVTHVGNVGTEGQRSDGILAQSIGGGGGNANVNFGGALNRGTSGIDVVVGGGTGDGGSGGTVSVTHTGDIGTLGRDSSAIFAQSVGGGGGNAELQDSEVNDWLTAPEVVLDALSDTKTQMNVTVGRHGGVGGLGGNVSVTSTGTLATLGDGSVGIRAQSVGNSGGVSGTTSGQMSYETKKGAVYAGSLQYGLQGGAGGAAGTATVTASGTIATAGTKAHAIHAQSVGGGGGVGGAVTSDLLQGENSLTVGIGGTGGTGGTGGAVTVTNFATLSTLGDEARGIYAQSIGGGGGEGGYAGVTASSAGKAVLGAVAQLIDEKFSKQKVSDEATTQLSALVGGTGGFGAAGSSVTVQNSGTIATEGRGAHGIDAQSIGGGGGDGGMVVSGSIARGKNSNSISVDVGGKGGEGGTGAAVGVTNEGLIHTTGEQAYGVYAQSVGGGGGNAGLMANLSVSGWRDKSSSMNVGVHVGGSGGIGASSGDVTVVNRRGADGKTGGDILTEGRAAYGLFAQSLGGGGGNGSSIVSADFAGGQDSLLIGVSVGGDGGKGGSSGYVDVTNAASIETRGDGAHAIVAQSIAGGGGNGGLVLAANAAFAAGSGAQSPLVTLGGGGGTGEDANGVVVTNSGAILTRGRDAHGILAQSIGGGGGNAGLGIGVTSNNTSTVAAGVLSALVGGLRGGGEGGLGGIVAVHQTGDVTVLGDGSQAVVAESINGGGGHVALDIAGITGLPGGGALPGKPTGWNPKPVFEFRIGATDAKDTHAERVILDYHGTFGAAGRNGAGSAAQSIGGGGGTYRLTVGLRDATSSFDDLAKALGRLGGTGGANDGGGALDGHQTGDVVTSGDNSPALLLQTIGGGGGRAIVDLESDSGRFGASEFVLGSEHGSAEEGGAVVQVQTGTIATAGDAAHGAIVQSIGGGGGALGFSLRTTPVETASSGGAATVDDVATRAAATAAATTSAPVTVRLGSTGGATLDGGTIDLALTGDVATAGDAAVGLVLQSVGGGGGAATVQGASALSVVLGGTEGASGAGGTVKLVHEGDVLTAGAGAHGVVVQSIGGGGGAAFGGGSNVAVVTSTANSGSGGAIEFVQTGDVVVGGAGAYGLVAQSLGGGGGFVAGRFAGSAGGAGAGGKVDVTVNGSVVALADGTTALFAQSAGGTGGGDVHVALAAGGQIVAGLGGTAVAIDGGAVNTLSNAGTVATLSGVGGTAIRGGTGGDLVANRGTIVGDVLLGSGANGFVNFAGATFAPGEHVDLGAAANLLEQQGAFTPGGNGRIATTQLAGGFRQSVTGTSTFELDVAHGTMDSVVATGRVDLAGTVGVTVTGIPTVRPGSFRRTMFGAEGGATRSGVTLLAPQSVVVAYALVSSGTDAIDLAYDVDFSPAGLLGNRIVIGDYVNRVQAAGSAPALADTITTLVAQSQLAPYSAALTGLGPEFYAEQQAFAFTGAQRFAGALSRCGSSADAPSGAGDCAWTHFDYDTSSHDAKDGAPRVDQIARRVSQGFQRQLGESSALGFALEYESNDATGDGGQWRGDTTTVHVGASGRVEVGRASAGAVLTFGHAAQDVHRQLTVGTAALASGERTLRFFTGGLDAAYRVAAGRAALTPALAIGATAWRGGRTTESGGGAQDLRILHGTGTTAWVEPSLAFTFAGPVSDRTSLRAFARVAALQYVRGRHLPVEAEFAAAPADVAPMRVTTDLDPTRVSGEVGFEIVSPQGYRIGLSYSAERSDARRSSIGSARIVIPMR
jgi:hypothetical protein